MFRGGKRCPGINMAKIYQITSIASLNWYTHLSTAPSVAPLNRTLPPGYVTKDLNNIQNWYRVIVNSAAQRPKQNWHLNQTSKFIKGKKKYWNITQTVQWHPLQQVEKGEGGMIIWCGVNIIHRRIQSYELRWVTKQVIKCGISHVTSLQAQVLFCNIWFNKVLTDT